MDNQSDEVPEALLYSTEHEWLKQEGEVARIGITHFAQDQLGDIVYVDLPEPGSILAQMQKLGEVESVKVVSEIFSPVSGEVVEANRALESSPELVNHDPYGEGWLLVVRMSDAAEASQLLDADAYRNLLKEELGEHA